MMPLHLRAILIRGCARLERKAYPATFMGQYFLRLRLIGCTCSAFPLSLSENKQLCHRGNEQCSTACQVPGE